MHLQNLCSSDKCLASFDHLVLFLIGFGPDCVMVNILGPLVQKLHCNSSVEKRVVRDNMPYIYVLSPGPHWSLFSFLHYRGWKPEHYISQSLLSPGSSYVLSVGGPCTRLKGRVGT